MPAGAVYVGRGSKWGNPFVVGRDGTRSECLQLYRALAAGFVCISRPRVSIADQEHARNAMEAAADELRGKDLACWCPPDEPCHADLLLHIANRRSRRAGTARC